MSSTRVGLFIAAAVILLLAGIFGPRLWKPATTALTGGRTHQEVMDAITPRASERMQLAFENAGAPFPPKEITLLASKRERRLELWTTAAGTHTPRHIHTWPLTATSGREGPKLREGDRQIPEGFYRITAFNPNSSYHLSLKLNYPNSFDQAYADAENRKEPGSNIFIHGKAVSIGCLAIGDPAIEELYYLIDKTGLKQARVIIAPHDPREFELIA